MYCPACRTDTLQTRTVRDSPIEVESCTRCGGLFFDARELERVTELAIKELAIPPDAAETGRVCPSCKGLLHTFDYPQTDVRVEMCTKCKGLWLDGRELDEIKHLRGLVRGAGELEEFAPVPGIKGALIRLIDRAIAALNEPP